MRKDWEVKKFGDLSIFLKNGLTIKQDKSGCGIPVTRIESLSNGVFNRDKLGYANIYDKEQYCDYILDDKDLLISHINSKQYVGRTVLYRKTENESIIHGMNLLRLKLNEDLTLPEFIVYYFKTSYIKEQIRKYRKDAVNQSSISINDIKKIRLLLPPLQTQQQIVEELDCLTSIIEKQKKQLEELDNLAQAIFYDIFGDPVKNEKGWNIKTLNELCIKITDGEHIKPPVVKEGIPFLSAKDITNGFVDFSDTLYVSEDFANKSRERCNPEFGDILVISRGATIGKVCMIMTHIEFCLLGSVILLKYKDTINGNYLLYYLKTPSINSIMKGLCGALAQPAIYLKDIKKINIPVPPIPIQQQFASKIKAIEKQKELIKKSIKETEDLFNSRMDYYFN